MCDGFWDGGSTASQISRSALFPAPLPDETELGAKSLGLNSRVATPKLFYNLLHRFYVKLFVRSFNTIYQQKIQQEVQHQKLSHLDHCLIHCSTYPPQPGGGSGRGPYRCIQCAIGGASSVGVSWHFPGHPRGFRGNGLCAADASAPSAHGHGPILCWTAAGRRVHDVRTRDGHAATVCL